jgi:hypothetical protein
VGKRSRSCPSSCYEELNGASWALLIILPITLIHPFYQQRGVPLVEHSQGRMDVSLIC